MRKFLVLRLMVGFDKIIRQARLCLSNVTYARPLIMGIETSCDDTGVAIVDGSGKICGECVKSQQAFSTRFGGVVPLFAAAQHEANLEIATTSALSDAGLTLDELDAIAVTTRPGLVVCLNKGLRYALSLCRKFGKPMIPIHHMQAHALTCRLTDQVQFPYVCLLISGGHALIVWVQSIDRFIILGRNTDCAPGDMFDKVARRLRLCHLDVECAKLSGGALIEKFAQSGDPFKFDFSNPSTKRADCNFSFSGIFIQALRKIELLEQEHCIEGGKTIPELRDMCASVQHAALRHMAGKLIRAFEYIKIKGWASRDSDTFHYPDTLVVSGGVGANNYIRKGLQYLCDHYKAQLICPPQKYCTDNGVMIAWNGLEKWRSNKDIMYNLPLDYYSQAKCPIGEDVIALIAAEKLTRKALDRAGSHVKLDINFNQWSPQSQFAGSENPIVDEYNIEKQYII